MGVWLGPRGLPKRKRPPSFIVDGVNYDGKTAVSTDVFRYEFERDEETGLVHWELVFWKTVNFAFHRVVDNVDLFIVGPGADGQRSSYSGGFSYGGNGGNGGEVLYIKGFDIDQEVPYRAHIGSPGSGDENCTRAYLGETVYTARCGIGNGPNNGQGGVGAKVADLNPQRYCTDGQPGVLSFNGEGRRFVWYGVRFGAGGGGGAAQSIGNTGVGNITIAGKSRDDQSPGSGGTSNGGNGGTYQSGGQDAGGSAQKNHGAGGGGGGRPASGDTNGGAGCPGILMIRNAR